MSLIVISGPPGAGKSTLAHRLGRAIGCPVISRDELREGLSHAGTPDPDGRLTYRLFTDTVTGLTRAGVSVIAEAAFQDHLWRPLLDPLLSVTDVRVIRCLIDPPTARSRIDRRGLTIHGGNPVTPDRWMPIALDVPVLEVDTSDGYRPSEAEIAAFSRR